MNRNSGFSLIELLVVITLMGFLTAFITGNFVTSLKKGRDARRKGDLENVRKALEMFYEDNRTYPTFDIFAGVDKQFCTGAVRDICQAGEKTYMTKIPGDPTAIQQYAYVVSPSGNTFQIYACMENTEQVLPYISNPPAGFTCSPQCYNPDRSARVSCSWGISSANTNP